MLLIWGFKARYKSLSEGTFACPNEGGDRTYRLRSARKWFTFFWIPVLPLGELGTFVECTSCGSTYDESVLRLPTNAVMTDNLSMAVRIAIVAVIRADGVVDPAEEATALEVASRFVKTDYGVTELRADLDTLDPTSLTDHMLDVSGMLNEHGKESLLTACLTIAAADGSIDDGELDQIRNAGIALGMTSAHINGVILEATKRWHDAG